MILAMWSGPRNLSTAMMRSFANRRDVMNVMDEPLYASYLFRSLKRHPMHEEILKSQPTSYKDCLLYTSPSPRDQRGSRMPSSA